MILVHEGHQEVTKSKHRLRAKGWWLGMDSQVERKGKECFECQLVSTPAGPEPTSSTKLTDHP